VRVPRSVDPKPVSLSGSHATDIAVMGERGAAGECQSTFNTSIVEQAQLNPVSHFRENGKVGSGSVKAGTEGLRFTRPDVAAHGRSLRVAMRSEP